MKNKKTERGQSLVELAISLVILLYLLGGAVEFGMAFFQFVQLRDAAQEGALFGSMNPPLTSGDAYEQAIRARVRYSSASPIDLEDPSVVPDGDIDVVVIGSPCEGNGLEVSVSYEHKIFMPFIPQLIGTDTIPLTAEVTDTILSPVCTGP
jgi:Flp pilus assembly protein TadG